MKPRRLGLLVAALAVTLSWTVVPTSRWSAAFIAHAQDSTPRTVSGAVLDANDQPVIGATVFLRNLKTKSVRSFTSVEKGHYYFAQVSKLEDYELWAEKGNKKSAVKSISTWDTRPVLVTDLKLK